ncbi:hypothetical protein IIO_03180 [Bacillus cereus VD115]|nr:hypothetical protein IIO_03180 [Bacillus cereus VD115]
MRGHFEKSEEAIDQMPLVSVLIPTYNRPHYFEKALCSVLEQTYPNIEIIIGDDSTNDETEKVLQKYLCKYSNINYIKIAQLLGNLKMHLCYVMRRTASILTF